MVSARIFQRLMSSLHVILSTYFSSVKYKEYVLCPYCLFHRNEKKCVNAIEIQKVFEILLIGKNEVCFSEHHKMSVSFCCLDLVMTFLSISKKLFGLIIIKHSNGIDDICPCDMVPNITEKSSEKTKSFEKVYNVLCEEYFKGIIIEHTDDENMSEINQMISCEKQLGVGSSAKVYRIEYQRKEYAMKLFSFDSSQFSRVEGQGGSMGLVCKFMDELSREMMIMNQFDCPYILKYFHISFEPLAMMIDLCPLGNLQNYLQNLSNEISPLQKHTFALQIAHAMSRIHSLNFIHRDLKSPNILMKQNENGEVICILSDFGTTGKIDENITVCVDNPKWTAPEALVSGHFTQKSDCYSFAIVLWEIITRKEPFGFERHMSKTKNAIIHEKRRPEMNGGIRKEYEEILVRNWDERPDERLEFDEIVKRLNDMKKLFE